ncbi:zinc finger protein dzip1 [Holotrichia oblita]|uniref:Zinc finger protein dzip1 n=1 Tax=Holotrichia oblita TaxID=644536 RepID=A0ACB9SK16_HOLOL|nr:zinc finger protein dzip1 [Holotrichia oblita]
MPRQKVSPRRRAMDESEELIGEVTVVDVYDIASEIGKECEKIIDQYGADAVTSLMPKVINALENLEYLATKNERENTLLSELKSKISQLENDKLEKAEYRRKFEKELEAIEEQWRSETKELVSVVSRLQEENRKLSRQDLRPVQEAQNDISGDGIMLQRLQASLEKQRDELRLKDKLLQEKCNDIEMLKLQVERLTGTSRELRRKHKSLQLQVRNLCDERADFLVQLQDQQRDITVLRQRLGLAQKENEDLAKSSVVLPSDVVVYKVDDPNRPRFTTAELKNILHERNELKAKVSDLEDELENYRPKDQVESKRKSNGGFNNSKIIDGNPESLKNELETVCRDFPIDEDAPVQGPLPYEPDDAPWKKSSESGMRKL